ncbi:MAG: transposase family protein, partial [Victivallales bacterium]|nr:transposase family protein [Victivallales bacterium]
MRKRLFCACCHSGRVVRRGTVARRFRLVPVGCRPTWLEFDSQRLECRDWGTVRQARLAFASPRKRYARAFARYVLELSQIGTIRDVAGHVGVGWDLVAEIQRGGDRGRGHGHGAGIPIGCSRDIPRHRPGLGPRPHSEA